MVLSIMRPSVDTHLKLVNSIYHDWGKRIFIFNFSWRVAGRQGWAEKNHSKYFCNVIVCDIVKDKKNENRNSITKIYLWNLCITCWCGINSVLSLVISNVHPFHVNDVLIRSLRPIAQKKVSNIRWILYEW